MKKSLKTEGVVIKRRKFSEADKILTIFTPDLGKITAISKGVRKIKSKMAGSLEPFNVVNLNLYHGQTFFTITGAQVTKSFENIAKNLQKTSKAFYLGELIDKFFEEQEKARGGFEIFLEALRYLDKNDDELVIRIFELKIIEESGFKPEIYHCVHCKGALISKKNYWDEIEGGIICSLCQKKFGHGKPISDDTIKLFRLIEKSDFGLARRLKINKEIRREAEEILGRYVESKLERAVKSRRFMKQNSS